MAGDIKEGHPGWWEEDPEKLIKLEWAFSIGCTDKEAYHYADITEAQFYYYQKKFPEFHERKEVLKEKPILRARNTIVEALDKEEHAKWYLERKRKSEFAQRQEHTGEEGEPIKHIFTWEYEGEENNNSISPEGITEGGSSEHEALECDSSTPEIWEDGPSDK